MWNDISSNVFDYLKHVKNERGAGYFVLIDPDRKNAESIEDRVQTANENDVDAIFVGGSLMMDGKYHTRVEMIKKLSHIPVIFFPGGVNQLNSHYDAMLFMSILSGRNPHYLIGEQVIAAPLVKDAGIETIPTAYLLIDGGTTTTVEFMSGTMPIPNNRPDIAIAHALAAQYLGMKMVYLEAGSGAKYPVSNDLISGVKQNADVSLIVGGGIKTPEQAAEKVKAGADFIVTGTVIESESGSGLMKSFADAIHTK
ncbi:MAG: geranylgeranylglyceryl/heptaprenylglyceryl phosphate synthase [Candidatus Marinimicrobia bacterium]|nr:geranylgeranylglyceryl/heptaprenylglyceryl phosphate synthase [Candidatus Neomarinimicrobiota bacterium]